MRTVRNPTGRQPRWRATLAAMVVLLTSGGLVALASSPAQALCTARGSNQTVNLVRPTDGAVLARETWQNTGTCDGLGDYLGKVQDSISDGSCARALFFEPNAGQNQVTAGVSCTTGAYANYRYFDRFSPASSGWFDLQTDDWELPVFIRTAGY